MTTTQAEIRYRVEYDEFPSIGNDFDFGDDTKNEIYLNRFETEELGNFIVFKEARCNHCDSWHHVESLCGIHAESEQEALQYFKEFFESP